MYFYAVADLSDKPLPDGPGIQGAYLLSLAHLDIAAIASPLTADEVPTTEANVWRHEAVVEALMADRAVLPMRFGTVLAQEATIRAVLKTYYADFVASLDRVRDRVEIGLRVLWDDDARRPTEKRIGQRKGNDGRTYLLARLEEERQLEAWRQRAKTLAAKLNTPLGHLAIDSAAQVLVTPRLLLTAAYLVERNHVKAFQREVEALSADYPALRFLCTGPWPPYSFVTTVLPEPTADHRPRIEEEKENASSRLRA